MRTVRVPTGIVNRDRRVGTRRAESFERTRMVRVTELDDPDVVGTTLGDEVEDVSEPAVVGRRIESSPLGRTPRPERHVPVAPPRERPVTGPDDLVEMLRREIRMRVRLVHERLEDLVRGRGKRRLVRVHPDPSMLSRSRKRRRARPVAVPVEVVAGIGRWWIAGMRGEDD